MSLTPQRPPGHASRKARAFEADIRRLRNAGYTLEAIREALAAAGVHVAKSTVQRELSRKPGQRLLVIQPSGAAQSPAQNPPPSSADAVAKHAPSLRTGREIAEDFYAQHNANPLLRARRAAKDIK
jgi:DNA-binding transcriptional MerR regulator